MTNAETRTKTKKPFFHLLPLILALFMLTATGLTGAMADDHGGGGGGGGGAGGGGGGSEDMFNGSDRGARKKNYFGKRRKYRRKLRINVRAKREKTSLIAKQKRKPRIKIRTVKKVRKSPSPKVTSLSIPATRWKSGHTSYTRSSDPKTGIVTLLKTSPTQKEVTKYLNNRLVAKHTTPIVPSTPKASVPTKAKPAPAVKTEVKSPHWNLVNTIRGLEYSYKKPNHHREKNGKWYENPFTWTVSNGVFRYKRVRFDGFVLEKGSAQIKLGDKKDGYTTVYGERVLGTRARANAGPYNLSLEFSEVYDKKRKKFVRSVKYSMISNINSKYGNSNQNTIKTSRIDMKTTLAVTPTPVLLTIAPPKLKLPPATKAVPTIALATPSVPATPVTARITPPAPAAVPLAPALATITLAPPALPAPVTIKAVPTLAAPARKATAKATPTPPARPAPVVAKAVPTLAIVAKAAPVAILAPAPMRGAPIAMARATGTTTGPAALAPIAPPQAKAATKALRRVAPRSKKKAAQANRPAAAPILVSTFKLPDGSNGKITIETTAGKTYMITRAAGKIIEKLPL